MTDEATATATVAPRYPIVDSVSLSRSQRSGLLGMRKPSRSPAEMVRPGEGHHVLVYRVDGEYVLDDASLDSRHDTVVRASHVTVVDTQRNAPIIVQLSIPARQSQSFEVRVTFGCTVVDPLVVVRQGLKDPQQLLTSYLLSYYNVMQMGLDYTVEQINEVRHSVHDELTAYQTVSPPLIDGLEIVMASVEVVTPKRVAERDDEELRQQDEHILKMSRLLKETQHQLAEERSRNARLELERQHRQGGERLDLDHEEEMAEQRQRHGHKLGAGDHEYERRLAADDQTASLARQQELNEFRREEVARHLEAFGGNATTSLYGEYIDGGMTQREIADMLRGDRERQALEARDLEKAEREDRAAERQFEREERAAERERERERDREQREREREERERERERDRERWEADRQREREDREVEREREREEQAGRRLAEEREHERHMKKLDHKRERQVERSRVEQVRALVEAELQNISRGLERESAEKQRESVVAVISSLASRGHLDMVNIDVEGLLRQIGGGGDVKKALEAAITDTASPRDDASDAVAGPAEESDSAGVADAEVVENPADGAQDHDATS
jgi:hypothetical protein